MRSARQVLSTKNETLNTKYLVLSTSEMTSFQIRNKVVLIGGELLSMDFMPWYCKVYKAIGEGKFAAIALMVREPGVKNSRTLFGHLLKQEYGRTGGGNGRLSGTTSKD